MKSVGVLVVLLLASVRVRTQDSSPDESPVPSTTPGTAINPGTKDAPPKGAAPAAPTTPRAPITPTAPPTKPTNATITTNANLTPNSTNRLPAGPPTENASPSSAQKPSVAPAPPMNRRSNGTQPNETVHPRTGQHNLSSDDTIPLPESGRGTPTPGPQNTTDHRSASSRTTLTAKESPPGSDAGPQTSDKKEGTDKRWWWIVLPALLIAAAVAIVLKFKSKKVHDPTETIDTGTENASFQRAENNKDGVMLLGVKSSGGEENDAAR